MGKVWVIISLIVFVICYGGVVPVQLLVEVDCQVYVSEQFCRCIQVCNHQLFWVILYCDTIGSIHFRLYWLRSENLFVCFGAKPTQRPRGRDLLRDQKWRREGMPQRRQRQFR